MYKFKSQVETYFSYYLEELKSADFVEDWWYERDIFLLSPPISLPYLFIGKNNILEKTEHVLHKASITADFTIQWTKKAENIFYLNREKPIKTPIKSIPFRLSYNNGSLLSLVEIKGSNESNTSSSISFPYKQKWLYYIYNILIQKIRPFKNTLQSDILFQKTFTPIKVINLEVYKKNCKFGNKGTSKLKYKYRTLIEFLNNFNNDNN